MAIDAQSNISRRDSLESVNSADERYRLLVGGVTCYAMILMDNEARITAWNAGAESILGWAEGEVLGRCADLIFTPEDRASGVPALELEITATHGKSLDVRWHIKKDGSRFFADGAIEALRDGHGLLCGFAKILRDATERAERERRERFLAELAERSRALTNPDEVIADAVRSAGKFFEVARCVFVDIDIEADTCMCHQDYRADESVITVAGTYPISSFGEVVVAEYGAGRTVVVDDVHLDRDQVPEDNVAAYDAVGIRSHVGVPVVHSSRLVSCIGVHSTVPRHWKPEEAELLKAIVERTWLTVELLRQQSALASEAEALRVAHERTAVILESITDAFFALDADWRFTYVNREAERLWGRPREQFLGQPYCVMLPQMDDSYSFAQHKRVMTERVPLQFEAVSPVFGRWVEANIYPAADGGLSVYFRDIDERKTLEGEQERLAERERNIAHSLQAALTPGIPDHVPGLALARYYEAALEEAGVGGDFYDVFPVDKDCTGLVVGDLSGKGLAAASQVATVRNMLRYALYRSRTIAGALQSLNSLLVEQDLLSGFATLFVGAYDGAAGTLTYVNCGQEPALLRRAGTGLVEHLAPTAPVLGAFTGMAFEEQTVAMGPGDALALFTDGLTEVGISRTAMLNIEGVADLLSMAVVPGEVGDAESMAEHLALRLIGGVDAAAAGGVMRDDMCLLVAVAEG